MSEQPNELLIDEVRKLRETGEALIDRVEDVAASIRYMTNNLLDEQYYPEMAVGVRQLAQRVSELVSLSPTAKQGQVIPPFTNAVAELSQCCQDCADDKCPEADDPLDSEDESPVESELPLSIESRIALLLAGLAEDAKQLAGCQQVGEVTAWQWWENRFRSVKAAVETLEYLEEEALGHGIPLAPHIERLGGIPSTLRREVWPEELVTAEKIAATGDSDAGTNASREGGSREDNGASRQTELFGVETHAECERADSKGQEEPLAAEAQESHAGGMDSFAPTPSAPDKHPYTLIDFRAFCQATDMADITAAEWQAEYRSLRHNREPFIAQLIRDNNAQSLKALAMQAGCMHAKSQKKSENAEAVYSSCVRSFVLGSSIQYNPMSERIEDAVDRIVDSLTDLDFQKHREEREQKQLQHKKAIQNPETLAEFYTFVREMGEHNLSDEQHLRRDQLYADMSRTNRAEAKPTSVERFQSDSLDGLDFSIKEGYHDKRQCPLWIVQLSTRVEKATYGELKTKAAQLGGWYSSFKKSDAGFQFLSREAAEKFAGLRESNADRTDELADRKIRKLTNTAARFTAMADRLVEQAEETLSADDDKLKNTVRRAEMAASTRARAREDLATAATLRSLAGQLQEGHTTYLDGIRYAVQIKTLRSLLRRAHWEHIKHIMQSEDRDFSLHESRLRRDESEEEPPDQSDIRFAAYPKLYLYRGHLEQAFAKLSGVKGVKQVTAKMTKLVSRAPKDQDYVEFSRENDIELLQEFLGRAKAAGYDCYWFDECLVDYKRLMSANICDAHELRAALAELLPHLTLAGNDDPITQATDALRGKELPGFFPTPKPLIRRMLELAEIEGTDRVLEPSAGMGDILDSVRQEHPDVALQAVEQNHVLAEVLAAKGHGDIVEWGDFLKHQGEYDVVLMNPPFEKGQDIAHVRHAYDLLSSDGRLVAIMSEGPFFRSDAQSTEFREWLTSLDGAHDEELPEDTFSGSDAFRQTGVRTRLLTIDKSV